MMLVWQADDGKWVVDGAFVYPGTLVKAKQEVFDSQEEAEKFLTDQDFEKIGPFH